MKPYYDDGKGIAMHHGDAIEVLRGMAPGSVDALVTDPPYTAAGGSTNGRSAGHDADSQFFLYWLRDVAAEISRVVRPDGCGFMFCDWRTINLIAAAFAPPSAGSVRTCAWRVGQALVWDRECIGLGSPFRNSFEMIAFVRGPDWKSALPKDVPTVIRHRYPYGRHEHHGAEKPVDLCRRLVKWACPPGGLVLDPFAGSGTTGIACAAEGMRFIGIERDDETAAGAQRRLSWELAARRLSQEVLPLGGAA